MLTVPNSSVQPSENGEYSKMVSGKAIGVIFLVCAAALVTGLYIFSVVKPPVDKGVVATLPIQFTPMDLLAGDQDAATSAVKIYNTDLVKLETVTMDAARKETVNDYTTNQKIGLFWYDATDVSICEQYAWYTVPYASTSNVYDNAFQFVVWNTDREVTMPMNVESGGTEITDDELEDLTTNGWDSAYAYIDFELRPDQDDMGYINSDNFLKGYKNNHYFVISVADVSGATVGGWEQFNVLGLNVLVKDSNDVRRICFPLSDTDLTRDLQESGQYVPNGLWTLELALDLTGFSAGQNITVTYDYIMYADWDRYVEFGNWGADMESTTDETFHIQY